MKVFEFSYKVDYGGGIMLIGAKTLENAEIIANDEQPRTGFWSYEHEHAELTYNGDNEGIITFYTFAG